MRRVIEFAQRALWRIHVRLAMIAVVAVAGGLATWQGMKRLGKSSVTPPLKQVATGVAAGNEGSVQPVSVSLAENELPQSPGESSRRRSSYGQAVYGQVADAAQAAAASDLAQPPANPYLPSSNDPAGGYGTPRSPYAANGSPYSQYASEAATSVPSDPSASTPAGSEPPENPYRSASASLDPTATSGGPPATYPSPSQSPYAPAVAAAADVPAATTESAAPQIQAASAPQAQAPPDSSSLAGSTYGRDLGSYGAGAAGSPAEPNPLPPPASSPASASPALPGPATSPSVSGPSSSADAALPPNPLPLAIITAPAASPYAPASAAPAAVMPYRGSATAADGVMAAAATPGERQLEGPQQPSLAVEKVSPAEVQIGKPATFELHIRNQGQVPAHNVVVTDHVPAGTQLQAVRPQPQQAADGSLVWNLGTMQPGEAAQISLQVVPQAEGEIGSTAQVTFAAAATSRSISTRPQLAIEHTAPPKVLIGESLTIGITISNPGTGPATGVIIEEDVPDGLSHVAGAQLEYEVGTLRPGESKRLELSLRAEKAGVVENAIRVRGEGGLAASHSTRIEIVAPQLQVGVEGPKIRFLERQATYTVQVANAGTAAARDIDLVAYLPRGLKFVATDSQGQYDPGQHAVFWSLAELPPAGMGAAKLTTLPVEPGEQKLKVQATAALNLSAVGEQVVQVEQAAELLHTVKDLDEVIEVGSETTYEIRVTNKGTKAATNVRIAAVLPPGLAAIGGDGPTRPSGDASQVVFEPLPALRPQEEVVYKIQAKGVQPGDHIVRVQLSSDESQTPVTREESTRVYQDR